MKALIVVALSLGLSAESIAAEREPGAHPALERTMPPVGGIVPPPGTIIANMDITVRSGPTGEPAVYELRSPLSVLGFQRRYASNAARAGYKIKAGKDLFVGYRNDGTSIRLRVFKSNIGSTGLLTVRTPSAEKV